MATEVLPEAFLVQLDPQKVYPCAAIDFGLATTKVVHWSKPTNAADDASQKSQVDSSMANISMAKFETGSPQLVIDYIKGQCDLQGSKVKKVIHVCGRGFSGHIKHQMEEELKCKIECRSNDEMLGVGLHHLLTSQSHHQLFYPPVQQGLALGQKMAELIMGVFFGREDVQDGKVEALDVKNDSPVIVADLGATFRFIKVNLKNGGKESEVLGETALGGNFFHGICGIFSGQKDFAAIRKMAEDHDGKTVEMMWSEMQASLSSPRGEEGGEKNMYDKLTECEDQDLANQMRTFNMEKMVTGNREDAKVGDAVQSLMHTVGEDILSYLIKLMLLSSVYRVCFTGSWIHSETFRKYITCYLIFRQIWQMKGKSMECEFLSHGSYTAAVGALLR